MNFEDHLFRPSDCEFSLIIRHHQILIDSRLNGINIFHFFVTHDLPYYSVKGKICQIQHWPGLSRLLADASKLMS